MRIDKEARKQMAKEYVQTHRPMGVYQIKNKMNGKRLIGSSINLDGTFNRHQFTLGLTVHENKELQQDWQAYGEENFSFEVLQFIKPREEILQSLSELDKYRKELDELEEIWLEEIQPYGERGYHKRRIEK